MNCPRRRKEREIPPSLHLLEEAAARVDDDMLAEIAAADYGDCYDAYLAGLRVLRDELLLLPPDLDDDWDHEVLHLVRWIRPERPEAGSQGGERGHWMRLFCCTALALRDLETPQFNYLDASINDQLGPMLDSIAALDVELTMAGMTFVEWGLQRAHDSADRAFLALAALLLECLRPQPCWEHVLARTRDLSGRIEGAWTDSTKPADEANGRLFGLTHFGQSNDLWLSLIARHLLTPAPHAPALVRAELEAVGMRLLPTTAARARRFGLPEPLVGRYYV